MHVIATNAPMACHMDTSIVDVSTTCDSVSSVSGYSQNIRSINIGMHTVFELKTKSTQKQRGFSSQGHALSC